MRKWVVLAVLFSFCVLIPSGADEESLQGFTRDHSASERQWESKFKAIPSPENQRNDMKLLSAHPHNVGTTYDKQNAEWILAQYKQFGWDAHIEQFDVLFPTPKERVLEMVAPTKFVAKLQEPPVAVDPTSNQTSEQLPTYNAYSADGDVTGPLVYANYGVPSDYEELERLGVSVKGAIVIVRYGGSWRGVKPKVAAEHGAVGCLIYSDPHDDGYNEGDVFPKGPMRPPEGVQRGSVMDFASAQPGDPLTPGVGATPDAKRLPVKDNPALTKIPVLPISYGDAQPLLAALDGPMAPSEWRGSLPIPYHVGPAAKVHLKVESNWDTKPLYDVIAKITGSEHPDEWVIRGNHHDGWVNGAEDPLSGQVAELEEARAMGELLKQGWKPKRTIIYCAWDGEEPGLLGSTEWAEAHDTELKQHAVAYINSDVTGRGYLGVEGSHTLEHFFNGVARDIEDPEKDIPVRQRLLFAEISRARSDEDRKEIRSRADFRIGALGSGSDYTAFLDHLGIASANLGFGGEDRGGIYHSIYDDFYWFTHFSDTDFSYGRAFSQTVGTAVMRLADADLLPFEFTDLADTIHMYLKQVKKAADDARQEAIERDKDLDDGLYSAVSDPRHPTVAPPREEVPPHLDFAPLDNAADSLIMAADRYQAALKKAWPAGVPDSTLQDLNHKLMESEHRLTTEEGVLRRGWYKHMIYAPGVYSGYGAKTLPGVREAIEQKHWDEANSEIQRLSGVLNNESALINSAAQELESAKH
ncbi:MAG TPA: transferrin receptor-like dimerization domain-containing protein [Candidatus Limnocylindrales bacterium]|nr:transferrin receptor-like dimerization domain-containing protein [Candidatus Limnocylindrales bacterium]